MVESKTRLEQDTESPEHSDDGLMVWMKGKQCDCILYKLHVGFTPKKDIKICYTTKQSFSLLHEKTTISCIHSSSYRLILYFTFIAERLINQIEGCKMEKRHISQLVKYYSYVHSC